jgi:hypothetical protein
MARQQTSAGVAKLRLQALVFPKPRSASEKGWKLWQDREPITILDVLVPSCCSRRRTEFNPNLRSVQWSVKPTAIHDIILGRCRPASHLRDDIGKVDEPQLKAMFETSAEGLDGLKTAFAHYEQRNESAWR